MLMWWCGVRTTSQRLKKQNEALMVEFHADGAGVLIIRLVDHPVRRKRAWACSAPSWSLGSFGRRLERSNRLELCTRSGVNNFRMSGSASNWPNFQPSHELYSSPAPGAVYLHIRQALILPCLHLLPHPPSLAGPHRDSVFFLLSRINQDWRTLQAYADNVDDAFQLQYGLAPTTQRYMSKWALTEVLGLMHRYLQVCVCVCLRV